MTWEKKDFKGVIDKMNLKVCWDATVPFGLNEMHHTIGSYSCFKDTFLLRVVYPCISWYYRFACPLWKDV